MSSRHLAFIQKRRSTRIYNAIPVAIQGSDAFRAPYVEHVSTIAVNCHGCRYQSKYEVIQGDMVYLEVKQSSEGETAYSCQARVKWVLRITNREPRFEIAVELVAPGNIWGIVSPPADWFTAQGPIAIEPGSAPREQPLAPRIKPQPAPALNEESSHEGLSNRASARAASLSPEGLPALLPSPFGQLAAGLGKQIQDMVSRAATAAFVQERDRLMDEFRTQLQSEATRTLERVVSTSKEVLNKRIEQEMKEAQQCMLAQANEVSRRVEGMRVGAIERLQRNMDASRTEAVERFLSRLREQLAPLLEDAEVRLRNLTAAENKLRNESQATLERFENSLRQTTEHSFAEAQEKTVGMLSQFESDVMNRLAESQQSLQEASVTAIAETTNMAQELYQDCEETVRRQLRSLVFSAADDAAKILKEKLAQVKSTAQITERHVDLVR